MTSVTEPPVMPALTPAMQAWDEQFRLFGSVRFGHKTRTVMLVLLLTIGAMAAGVWFGIRDSGSADTTAIVIVLGIAGLIALPVLYFFVSFRKKSVIVETEGVRLTNGALLPWDGIEFAGVWSYRSSHSVALNLTDEAMQAYKARQSGAARALTRANAALVSSNAVFLPGTLDATPDEFAAWLNYILDERRQRAHDPFA